MPRQAFKVRSTWCLKVFPGEGRGEHGTGQASPQDDGGITSQSPHVLHSHIAHRLRGEGFDGVDANGSQSWQQAAHGAIQVDGAADSGLMQALSRRVRSAQPCGRRRRGCRPRWSGCRQSAPGADRERFGCQACQPFQDGLFQTLQVIEDGADHVRLIHQQVDAPLHPGPFGQESGQGTARQGQAGQAIEFRPGLWRGGDRYRGWWVRIGCAPGDKAGS